MGSRSTPLFASQLQGARSQQVNRHKATRSTSPTTLSAPPVAACHHQRAHFPGSCSTTLMQSSIVGFSPASMSRCASATAR